MKKPKIALTGPSVFSPNVRSMIEDYLGFNYYEVNHNDLENLQTIAQECDGLVLAGGVDLFPPNFGNSLKRGQNLSSFDPRRDIREKYLLKSFQDQQKPIMGICRGFQLICVEAGLKLILDLSFSNVSHSPTADGMKLDRDVCDDSHKIIFYDKDNKSKPFVNSIHHQGIESPTFATDRDKCYLNFIAYAETKKDKPDIVEWVEAHNLIAVQFHPEASYKHNITSQIVIEKFRSMFL